ncbi:MAG TPA: bifunctional phosphoribosylaminoimidazolecarboxamide formyltransferase/IMP cyclohydrolase [Polyangiaceae bacterium]|nr:bifunctional phosphoribosylaminoimidazolecarboxamide formyltransferase/IMP cyclohydrolase [Polyangiaceae bacterium]
MPIRRALLSVSDKTGLVSFARALSERKVELLSTGGTYKTLEQAGIPVVAVDAYTGSPEVMDGRVKTLHPKIHGGILAREGHDEADLERIGAGFIDLVVVNLYPFEQTLKKAGASFDELIENIDIGGPSMVRSAAKNHARVAIVTSPSDYGPVLEELESTGEISVATRKRLAGKAFAATAAYDAAISGWMTGLDESDGFPKNLTLPLKKGYGLRYGENPHQRAAFYVERDAPAGSLARAESLGSGQKELSFNNLVDAAAALEAVRELRGPGAVVIKHACPCGAATAPTLARAYHEAREADPVSAFGGIVALNRTVDEETAHLLAGTFLECIVAPNFEESALEVLRKKANLRLLATGEWLEADHEGWLAKGIGGGYVVQERDRTASSEVTSGQTVTKAAPSAAQAGALEFAWAICKHVRSNAILIARELDAGVYATVGIGGGQTSRVSAVKLAVEAAGDRARGAVLASDAFFPFADGLLVAADAGVAAVAQPGGSKKDQEVISAADDHGIAMVFTGNRHFRH